MKDVDRDWNCSLSKLKFGQYFAAEAWWGYEMDVGQDYEVKVWSKCWYMVDILKLMLGRDSKDGIWSRFVYLSRTQPSGLLCLWQCLKSNHYIANKACAVYGKQTRLATYSQPIGTSFLHHPVYGGSLPGIRVFGQWWKLHVINELKREKHENVKNRVLNYVLLCFSVLQV